MYKPINGWTKKRILEVIQARPLDEPAVDGKGYCVYLAPNGNKCAAGLFIPTGHPGVSETKTVNVLLKNHPDLEARMPLRLPGMILFQFSHDHEALVTFDRPFKGNAKAAMLDWVERNVEND